MFKSNKANRATKAAKQQQQPVFKQDYFTDCHRTYSCIHCRAHLANHDELISKLFQGNHGRAYLFNKVVNIGCKQAVQRELLTGLHAVADIYCDSCETTLGWKYEQAFVPSQKYKEGKYIIELVHMLKENNWDLTSYNTRELLEESTIKSATYANSTITTSTKGTRAQQEANIFKVGGCYIGQLRARNNNNNLNSYNSGYTPSSGCGRYNFSDDCYELERLNNGVRRLMPVASMGDDVGGLGGEASQLVGERQQQHQRNQDSSPLQQQEKQIPPISQISEKDESVAQQLYDQLAAARSESELVKESLGKLNLCVQQKQQEVEEKAAGELERVDIYQQESSTSVMQSQNNTSSPKDSLCSSQSHSDLSSSDGQSGADGSTQLDEIAQDLAIKIIEASPSPSAETVNISVSSGDNQ